MFSTDVLGLAVLGSSTALDQVNALGSFYTYLFTNLDFHTIDFGMIDGSGGNAAKANIWGFSIVDKDNQVRTRFVKSEINCISRLVTNWLCIPRQAPLRSLLLTRKTSSPVAQPLSCVCLSVRPTVRARLTDRPTDRQTDRPTDPLIELPGGS